MSSATMHDLPEEVLEIILALIPPYKGLHDCMLVSKRWRRCVLNVAKTKRRNFLRSINNFDVKWDTPAEMDAAIEGRYSHSCVVHENSMYVFGGCTSWGTRGTNHFWRLDLSKRQWIQLSALGTYPSRKACGSLVIWKDSLLLFGGWRYSYNESFTTSEIYNELHVYDISENIWTCINTINTPPPMAGHSVSVIGKWMIVVGGLQKLDSHVDIQKSNDVWRLNLEDWTWHKPEITSDPKPGIRFWQTQTVLNDENVLIVGGSSGICSQYNDSWILNMSGNQWKWIEVDVRNMQYKPSYTWNNPGCRVGDKIVILNRVYETEIQDGRFAGIYSASSSSQHGQAGRDQNREPLKTGIHYLGIYLLDISQTTEDNPVATWLPPKNVKNSNKNGPEERIMYSLVEGNSELVMYGGIHVDARVWGSFRKLWNDISNSLNFISSPKNVNI